MIGNSDIGTLCHVKFRNTSNVLYETQKFDSCVSFVHIVSIFSGDFLFTESVADCLLLCLFY